MKDKFTSEDFEYFYIIVHLMENILELKKKVTITTDLKFFNKYNTNKLNPTDLGACIRETGLIWLNEKELATETRPLAIAVIIHELLHIAYPLKDEEWINSAVDAYIKVYYGEYPKR